MTTFCFQLTGQAGHPEENNCYFTTPRGIPVGHKGKKIHWFSFLRNLSAVTVLGFGESEDQLQGVTVPRLLEAVAEEADTFQTLCWDLICK